MVEHNVFVSVGVDWIALYLTENRETVGEFHDRTCFNSLPRIGFARTDPLIRSEGTPRLLAPGDHVLIVPIFGLLEAPALAGLPVIRPWISKALGEVDHVVMEPLIEGRHDVVVESAGEF